MTIKEDVEILGADRASDITRLAVADGVPHETRARLRFAATLELATRFVNESSGGKNV